MEKYIENKLSIIIPTYNEAENIVKLLNEIIAVLDNKNFEIIVVDDDSKDSTASRIINNFKNEKKIKLIQRKQRRDLVQSIKLALQTISGSNFLVMDGDGQHDPKDIPSTLELLKNNDLVIGTRNLRDIKSISKIRVILSKFFNLVSNIILKQKISDPLTGFFAGKIHLLNKKFFSINNSGFKVLLDLIFANKTKIIKISECKINFRIREKGESKLDASIFFSFITQIVSYCFNGLISSKFIGFMIIGGFGFILHFLMMFYFLKMTTLNFIWCHLIATLITSTFNFTINNYLNFYERKLTNLKSLLIGLFKYYIINIPGILSSLTGASFAYNLLTNNPYIASLVGVIFDGIFKFIISINWIWKSK